MATRSLSLFFASVFLVSLICTEISSAQTAPKKCAPVTPKNRQEALMMEQTTNKTGCWVRDPSTGQLVFLSDLAPDKNYNPVLNVPKSGGCNPVLGSGATTSVQGVAGASLAGTWQTTSGVYPGEGELALSRKVQPGSIQRINNCDVTETTTDRVTIIRMPDGRFCNKFQNEEICFVQQGLGSYTFENGYTRCTYRVDGSVLRGACVYKPDTGSMM